MPSSHCSVSTVCGAGAVLSDTAVREKHKSDALLGVTTALHSDEPATKRAVKVIHAVTASLHASHHTSLHTSMHAPLTSHLTLTMHT
jgi:hypothetical protein